MMIPVPDVLLLMMMIRLMEIIDGVTLLLGYRGDDTVLLMIDLMMMMLA
jgi:hypothetical protein